MPAQPTPNTDAARLLEALQVAYPEPSWDPNSRLQLTAHSRASDLRELGWDVRACRIADPAHRKGRRHGYRLETPRGEWDGSPQPHHPADPDGQLRIA